MTALLTIFQLLSLAIMWIAFISYERTVKQLKERLTIQVSAWEESQAYMKALHEDED